MWGCDTDDTSPAARMRGGLIARSCEEEETLDGLLDEDFDLDVTLDAVDDPTFNALLLLRRGRTRRVLFVPQCRGDDSCLFLRRRR